MTLAEFTQKYLEPTAKQQAAELDAINDAALADYWRVFKPGYVPTKKP